MAVSLVDGQILFFHPETGHQMASIEGKHDLGYARKETDKVTGKKLTFGRFEKKTSYEKIDVTISISFAIQSISKYLLHFGRKLFVGWRSLKVYFTLQCSRTSSGQTIRDNL